MGSRTPEYYFLSALCYQNIFLYDEFRLLESTYDRRRPALANLKNLIQGMERQNTSNYQIYLLAGIIKKIRPEIGLPDAKSYFDKSISLHKENPFAYNYLSLISSAEEKYEDSIRLAERAIKLKPDFPEPYVNLAYAYAKKKNKEKAYSALIECLQKCPRVPVQAIDSVVNLISKEVGVTLFDDGTSIISAPGIPSDKDRASLIKALQGMPLHRLELADKYLEYGNWVEAKAFLEGFEPPVQYRNTYYFIKASYQLLGGNKEGFNETSSKLLANKPTNYRHLLKIGNLYFGQGEFDRALAFYQAGIKRLDPLDVEYGVQLNYNLGACYLQKGNINDASRWIDKALAIDPGDATSLFGKGMIYFKQVNKQKAKSMFLKAKAHCPEQDSQLKASIDEWMKKVD